MLTLIDLLREDGINLHGSGDNLSALCPFHKEKTPSFSVNVRKDVYLCHGCGVKGNAITYLKKYRGMSAREAMQHIEGTLHSKPQASRQKPKGPRVFPKLPAQNAAGAKRISVHEYHDAEGQLISAICRYEKFTDEQREEAKKRGRPYRKCDTWSPTNGGWLAKGPREPKPLYRLPRLLKESKDKQVMIVEGEKCVEAVEKAFSKAIVTTWMHGKNSFVKSDLSPLHGRSLLLVADSDSGGRASMKKLSGLLYEHCPKIRLVLPEGETKDDIADWIEKGGSTEARARISELVQDAQKPKKKAEQKPLKIDTEEIFENNYFKIMGNIADAVAVMISTYRMLLFSRTGLCRNSSLVSIADYQWWLSLLGTNGLSTSVCLQVGSSLIRKADKMGQIDPKHLVGRGFFKAPDGSFVWHLGNRLNANGKDVGLGEIPGFLPVSGPPIRISDKIATEKERHRLAQAILGCRWETESDGRKFMAWLVSSVIGGGLNWRPHAWLNGLSESGKSWLLDNVAKPICGDFFILVGDPSVAGVARAVRSDSLAVFFDEAEPNRQHIESILDILRLSSSGIGARIRADRSTSGVDFFQPRFSAMMSSINVAQMNVANETRFCTINLSREKREDWPAVEKEINEAMGETGMFLAAIVADGADIVKRAEEIRRQFIQEGVSSRRAAIESVLTAGWEWWSGETKWLFSMETQDPEAMDDGERMLFDILGIRFRVPKEPDRSLASILKSGDGDGIAIDYGLKRDGGVLHIHPSHPELTSRLSKTESWSNVNIKRTLLQIPGATISDNPLFFGALRRRSVQIPKSACNKMGLDIFGEVYEPEDSQEDELPF